MADGRQPAPAGAVVQGVEQGDQDADTRGAEGVPERDGAAEWVQLLVSHAQHPMEQDVVQRKRLVVLEHVEVGQLQVQLGQQLLDGGNGRLRKSPRLPRGPAAAQDPRHGSQTMPLDRLTAG